MGGAARVHRGRSPASRILGIYLNDHLAGATVGVELARRVAHAHRDSAYGSSLDNLARQIALDRQALLRLMESLEVPVRRYKVYGAWVSEKLGRLKPNGRLVRRSGLSTILELEALRLGVEGKALLWRALIAAAALGSRLDTGRLHELLGGARQQLEVLDSLHGSATSALLSPGQSGVLQAHARP